MKPELSIKLDYLDDRQNPAEIFEAMAEYINAYRDFGQLLTGSVGFNTDFEFQLNDIEKGSILSKLSALPGKIDQVFEAAFYNSGNDLFDELTNVDITESEEQVEELAADLETSLVENLPQQIADPHIDRQGLATVLDKFSTANQKMKKGESVILKSGGEDGKKCELNTAWRFTGNPKDMFLGETEYKEFEDKLYVKVSVNEGHAVWKFKSLTLEKTFSARIINKDWLEKYQDGLIPPIGPKDIIKANVSLDFYTPQKGKGQPQIRNAKVISITNITRYGGHQYELTDV
ncbi:hypothetical protein [Paraglaciecola sp.]|uniref:hypothetical protein n=1 Tax=Paraglaciecola sp. TaxID=1920173 RepID=UPI003265397E